MRNSAVIIINLQATALEFAEVIGSCHNLQGNVS